MTKTDNDSFTVVQFACHPPDGHAIYERDLEAGGAFFAADIRSAHGVPTIIKSATVHAKVTVDGKVTFDGDLKTVVELDALEPGQADVIQWHVPNKLLVAEGFRLLNGLTVDFTLIVVHGAKGKSPVMFTHKATMKMLSSRPVQPEINVQFRGV